MVTRRGAVLLAGAVVCWAAGRLLGLSELYIVAVAAVALVGTSAAALGIGSSRIAVRRRLSSARAAPGQRLEVGIDLRNDSRLPTGSFTLEDACPYRMRESDPSTPARPRFMLDGVPPSATRTVSYPITAAARGRWQLGPLRLHLRDPFGVAERERGYEATSELLVYPRVEPLPTGPRLGSQAGPDTSGRHRLLGSGDEFHTVREYRTGDDLRKVHWASTARQQRLMVRQNEQSWAARATVLLDTRAEVHGLGEHGSFEAAVTAAASVLSHLDGQGYDTRLVTMGDEGATRPTEPLERHLERLVDVQAARGQSLGPTLQALNPDGLLVVVLAPPHSDPADAPDVRALLAFGKRFSAKAAMVSAGGARTSALVTLLLAARWRAAALDDGVAAAWGQLETATRRQPA